MSSVLLPRLIGVVHLPPLVGAAQIDHQHPVEVLQEVGHQAVHEVQLLAKAGFEGVILQNFGDTPYFYGTVPPETVACMSIIAAAVREVARVSMGIQVLGQDLKAALAIASVTGCDFIRVSVDHSNELATFLREKARLHSEVGIIADYPTGNKEGSSINAMPINVKNDSWMNGVVVDHSHSNWGELKKKKLPLYVDVQDDATLELIRDPQLLRGVGVILGSVLRKDGNPNAPLDGNRAKEMAREMKKLFRSSKSVSKKTKSRKA